ncbi:hypothetical protein [Streptomyces sp. NBC_01571]|uniref:hypothetical protein n=1 Tax=Streptomyces sp. NBC_01571 TaxID=2975883 RepID=UPI0022513690|nr:hypothetical protein [Streptomyces sp. NBC_01571]
MQADAAILPATNSLALGGLGSGKSTTAKTRIRREILHHAHQAVVIDSFGEESAGGEWAPLVRSLGGRVIEAGAFTLNPCSNLFPAEVREQLVRSLILAVEPGALTYQATHALQHALNHPKATSLNGLVDALVSPESGRWPAAKLSEWGEGAAIALSRYTEGSLRGLFDGQDASLPETDLPILSFDFSSLDRNSPAIPSLMAAVSCWAEHVWLRQSTAVHRHLVLEEAWQILLSPATSELIQRLLKNSRKAALSLDVVMHTLSDLGEGRAQDLARLCEIAHVGRLGPEEAAIVGSLLGLPAWAVERIPALDPGQAVWKVGPDYVDIIQTVLDDEEAALTDTSSRRRKAQQAFAVETDAAVADATADDDQAQTEAESAFGDASVYAGLSEDQGATLAPQEPVADDAGWGWDMPPNVIDTRHGDVLQAAREGRCSEAAQLAAIGEREDINAFGINSDQAVSWLSTRARVADLSGSPDQAVQLRATVARMGKDDVEWFQQTDDSADPAWHSAPQPPTPELTPDDEQSPPLRQRGWPYVAAIAALAIAGAGVWQSAANDKQEQQYKEKAAAYKGVSVTQLNIDGVKTEAAASWSRDGRSVVLSVWVDWREKPKLVRIDSGNQTAKEQTQPLESGQFPMPIHLEVKVPVKDRYQAVRLIVAVGGSQWKKNSRAPHRAIEFHPDRTAIDTETGKHLKQYYSRLL